MNRRWSCALLFTAVLVAFAPLAADAYITHPVQTLGQLCGSTYITVVRVEKISKEKGIIVYRKVQDLKGNYPRETIRHIFDLKNTPAHKGAGDVPVRPDEKDWKYAIDWAEVGKTAVIFSLKYDPFGDFGHTYIHGCWYATMCPARDWDLWYSIYADPALLTRWHCGSPAYLASAVEDVLAGKDAVVPVISKGDRDSLRAGKAEFGGLKVSMRLPNYDLKRDAAPWQIASPFPAEALAAWKTAGADAGWLRVNKLGDADFFPEPGKKTDLPAFRLKGWKDAKLVDPGVPFALDLRGSPIGDAGTRQLSTLKSLKAVYLINTNVSDAGAAELRKALPDCTVTAK